MGLDQLDNPTVEQANDVLVNCMPDPMLRTFGCLCMKLPGCQGIQRIRSYPFGPGDLFHKRNHRPTVFVIPPKRFSKLSYSCFDFKGPDDVASYGWGGLNFYSGVASHGIRIITVI